MYVPYKYLLLAVVHPFLTLYDSLWPLFKIAKIWWYPQILLRIQKYFYLCFKSFFGQMMIPEISIPLNEIINVKGMQDSGCDFIVQTESYGNFYVTVANLRKYTSELGLFLKSTWETTIKEVKIVFYFT